MEQAILIGGSGGQGVLFLGRVIATVAMLLDRHVTWLPSYGAEMRGGTANCTVVVSDEPVGSPIVREIDYLIVLNSPSLNRFVKRLKRDGTLIYDASLIKGDITISSGRYRVVPVRASEVAARVGSVRYANMVLLGAYLRLTGLENPEVVKKALEMTLPERHRLRLQDNLRAVEFGYNGHGL